MRESFDAFVTAAVFLAHGRAAFALGDGQVRFEGGGAVEAHGGAILAAAATPDGTGVVTGGDDGRVALTTPEGSRTLAEVKGRWIESLAVSKATGLVAFGAGRDLHVRDLADPKFERVFQHEKSVADVAFEPKGRRIAVATYGGAQLWYARIAEQKPVRLNWAGSHVAVVFSPDARFLISSMQENQLHGWRISDAKDMRMGGYPAKVKSLAFLAGGDFMATSGAPAAIVWPFGGANGPMGKSALEIGHDPASLVARVAAAEAGTILAAGLEDGRVWATDIAADQTAMVRAEKGAAISALAVSPDAHRIAWGDEDGEVGVWDVGF